MENQRRHLTLPYEPISNQNTGGSGGSANGGSSPSQTISDHSILLQPPSLKVTSPSGDVVEGSSRDISSIQARPLQTTNEAEIFKLQPKLGANGAQRQDPQKPQLSLNIAPVGMSRMHSDNSSLSALSTGSSGNYSSSLRQRTIPGTSSRSGSISGNAPKSAKVISFIGAEDMDEFKDLQKEFQAAVGKDGLSWLPQKSDAKTESEDEDADKTFFTNTSIEMHDMANISSPKIGKSDFFHKSPSKVPPPSPLPPLELRETEDEDSLATHKLDKDGVYNETLEISTTNIQLPDFDEIENEGKNKHFKLYGNSLGIFPPTHKLRRKLAQLHLDDRYKQVNFILLVILTALWSVRTFRTNNTDFYFDFTYWIDVVNFMLTIYFSLNDFTKIIAFGFWDDSQMFTAFGKKYTTIVERLGVVKVYNEIQRKYNLKVIDAIFPFKCLLDFDESQEKRRKLQSSMTIDALKNHANKFDGPRAFARSSWNRVDITSTVSFWIGLFLSLNNYDDRKGIRIFRALALLRILRLLNTDTGVSSILRGIKYGMPQFVNIGLMLVYFWLFFGILGVLTFRGSLRRQCVWINPDDPSDTYQYDMQFCGGYLDPVTKEVKNYIFSDGSEGPRSKGFICPQYSKCISDANPYNGRISFDNIANSMELIFVIMSANTFTDIMYYTMDSDEMAACLFFIFSAFILTLWLVNLLIATLYSAFEISNEKFKKEKNGPKSVESLPLRLVSGYWKYFQVKAGQTELPQWSLSCLKVYSKIERIFTILILVDIVTRATYDSSENEFDSNLWKIEYPISITLFIESIIRLMLYSPNPWKFLTKINYVYDFIVAVITLIISCIQYHKPLGQVYFWLAIFHISRFYRIIMDFNFTRLLWKRVLGNAIMIWNLSAFYFLFMFLVSVIMSVFLEGTVPADDAENLPFAMYNLKNSFLALFIIGSTENWTDIVYGLQQYSPNISSAFFSTVLFILWFILSNFVILNIFIALIAQSLTVKEEDKRPLQIKHYLKHIYPEKLREYTHVTLLNRIKKKLLSKYRPEDSREFKQFLMNGTAIMSIAQNMEELSQELNKDHKKEPSKFATWMSKIANMIPSLKSLKSHASNPFFKKPEIIFTETIDIANNKTYMLQLNEFEDEKLDYLRAHPTFNNSYFIIPPNNGFRKLCQRLVPPSVGKRTDGFRFYEDNTDVYSNRQFFNNIEKDLFVCMTSAVTILLIIVSCYSTPLYEMNKHSVWDWTISCELSIVIMFTIEFIVKTVADGFIYSPNAYLRSFWNRIDYVVLTCSWVNFVYDIEGYSRYPRIVKALTALRALRCLTISNTARQTFKVVMIDGFGKIFEAAFVSVTLLIPFSIWGLGIFTGRLGTCNDSSLDMDNCYNEFTNKVFQWDILMPRTYQEPYLYLNTFPSAFKSLYEITSLEGWVDLLENMMNSTGVGTVTSLLATPINGLFPVLFNFSSMVFILNLFVSFIISNHAKAVGTAYLTSEEKSWLEVQKLLSQAKPKRMPNLFEVSGHRQFLYQLAVEKKYVSYAIFLQFILYSHVICLLSISYKQANSSKPLEVYFMITSTVFFVQELFCIIAKGPRIYFTEIWDTLKFVVVLCSFIMSIIGFMVSDFAVWFQNIKQVFHLLIFSFIIPQNDTLSELIETAMASLPSILSLTYTWGILFIVYAIALNQTFGLTKLGPNTTDNLNFRTVIKSLIVLFRCSFGEGWNYIMDDLTLASPFCYNSDDGEFSDCGSTAFAYIILMSWNIISMYIFVNMFISLMVANFSYIYRRGNSDSVINKVEIRKFRDAWLGFDSEGTGELEFSYLPRLMHSYDGPLSFRLWEGRLSVKSLVSNYMTINPEDPYDVKVDLEGLNTELRTIDKQKAMQRRFQYRRFVQEVHYSNGDRGAIKFSKLLHQIPLYTMYDPRECLGIDSYVRHLYTMGKVDKYLNNQRNFDVLNMVVTRWKYHLWKRIALKEQTHGHTIVLQEPASIHETSILTTPKIDFGVNNFIWTPRDHVESPTDKPTNTYQTQGQKYHTG